MKKNRIIPTSKEKGKIISNKPKDKLVRINFRDIVFCSAKIDGFTNYLHSEEEYTEFKNTLFHKFIPECEKRTLSEIRKDFKHHIIKGEELKLVNKILVEYEKKNFPKREFLDDGINQIYQIGFQKGFRCVGTLLNDDKYFVFSILFFDPYHLIYADKNYNHNDTEKNRICLLYGGNV